MGSAVCTQSRKPIIMWAAFCVIHHGIQRCIQRFSAPCRVQSTSKYISQVSLMTKIAIIINQLSWNVILYYIVSLQYQNCMYGFNAVVYKLRIQGFSSWFSMLVVPNANAVWLSRFTFSALLLLSLFNSSPLMCISRCKHSRGVRHVSTLPFCYRVMHLNTVMVIDYLSFGKKYASLISVNCHHMNWCVLCSTRRMCEIIRSHS